MRTFAAAALALALTVLPAAGADRTENPVILSAPIAFNAYEFRTDFSRGTVPLDEFATGAFKDGIPAIDHPRFAAARETGYLRPLEPVIELGVGGYVRAYPVQILIWHEIVNDRVGGVPVAVTFCPLCNTAIAFDRRVEGRILTFGVSGKLRNSDLVMYDRETESWWQQFGGAGLVGHYAGARLRRLPVRVVAWRDFRQAHPQGLVLLRPTGGAYPYGTNPYAGYDAVWSPPGFDTANEKDRRLQPKERVVFVERGGESVAVPLSTLVRHGEVRVTVGGHRLVVRATGQITSPLDEPAVYRGELIATAVVLENGRPVPFDTPFWFAVAAFRPEAVLVR